jgi:hypothetical protein
MSITVFIAETEAHSKLCCLPNAEDDAIRQGCCVGLNCMAWRWAMTNIFSEDNSGASMPSGDTHGYCGLAGKPWGVT